MKINNNKYKLIKNNNNKHKKKNIIKFLMKYMSRDRNKNKKIMKLKIKL